MLHNPNAALATQEPEYRMLVRQDEHGVRYLVKDNMSERTAARELQMFIEAAERKPHKKEYFLLPYTAATKYEVLARERVNL